MYSIYNLYVQILYKNYNYKFLIYFLTKNTIKKILNSFVLKIGFATTNKQINSYVNVPGNEMIKVDISKLTPLPSFPQPPFQDMACFTF